MLPADHPLAAEPVITPAHLDGVPFISLFSEHFTYFKLANAFAEAGAHWNVIVEAYFFSTCCALVKRGVGVSICDPHTAINQADDQLVVRRFEPRIDYEMIVMHAQDRPKSQIRDSFTMTLNKYLQEYVEAINHI